ncbi:MAG: hypothetical protein SFW65_07650 [Alphaproteobacteria bacterium]|nr:hypothetical protein [Alphaproteobacteria bacterium]
MSSPSPDSSTTDKTTLVVVFLITLALAALYAASVGIVAIWPDSLLYADRARHLLEEGRLALSAQSSSPYPPLYSLLLALIYFIGAFSVPDFPPNTFLMAHQILIGLQVIFMASVFFPVRGLLLRNPDIGKTAGAALACIAALSSAALPYTTMLGAEALFIPLFIWFTYFYDKFLYTAGKADANWCAILLAFMLLATPSAWIVYAAVALTEITRITDKKSPWPWKIILLPLAAAGCWETYSIAILGQPFKLPELNLNNGLARFNFFKNGVLYLCYVGMPLAGMAFVISIFSKKAMAWGDALFRFTFFTLLCALLYLVFANEVIVERKLDYITNRIIEPFVILPFILFIRLQHSLLKEITANSLLIFFCLMIFGFPYNLKTDFVTGMSYWAQSLPNPNLGIIRNVVYLLLLCLPIIVIWWKPKWFVTSYACIAALLTFSNLMQNQTVWSINEDGNFRYVNTAAFAASRDIKDAKAVYVDNQCSAQQSTDIAYLFRCNDLNKILYFTPRAATAKTAESMMTQTLGDDDFVLFASSENDNSFGKSVAEIGLGKLMRVEKGDLANMQKTPLVFIKGAESLGRYINVRIAEKMERVTLLGPNAVFHIDADKAGCAELNASFAADDNETNANGKTVEFMLNNKLAGKTSFKPVTTGVPPAFALPLQLKTGENTLKIHYDVPPTANGNIRAGLFMFARPIFKPCN